MSVLAASIATALAAKGAPTPQIIVNVLVALSVSTLLTGVLLYGVGALKMGQWLRFIPYPVIGGFLAASGILLVTGGMEVVTQTNLTLSPSSWEPLYSPLYAPQILIGALFAVSIPVLGRWVAELPRLADCLLRLPYPFGRKPCSVWSATLPRAAPGSCRASARSVCGGR